MSEEEELPVEDLDDPTVEEFLEEAEALLGEDPLVYVRRMVRLDRQEERALLEKAQGGDKNAMGRLIEAHTAFVMKVSKNFTYPVWVTMEDIRQEGIIGLMDAVKRFDLSKYENKFLTYAYYRIHKAIQGYLTEMGYSMRMPFADVMKLKAAQNRLDFHMSEDIEKDSGLVNQSKSLHMFALLMGCVPINPTDATSMQHRGIEADDFGEAADNSLALRHDTMSEVLSELLANEIESTLGELTVLEGVMVSMHLGIFFKKVPTSLLDIAGEAAVVEDDGNHLVIHPGRPGFGLEVGEPYNSCSRLIKLGEAKFRSILKRFFGDLDEHWRHDA